MAADPSATGTFPSVNSGNTGGTPTKQPKQRSFAPKQIFATVLIVLAVVLGLENTHSTNIRLIGPVESTPLWVLVFAPLVLGLIAGFLLGHRGGKKKR